VKGALTDRAAIVGIGQTAFGKGLAQSETELAAVAVLAALEDAGIAAADVDGMVKYSMETTSEVDLARNLGVREVTYFGEVGYGGGAACATVGHAAMAVATGQCRVAVAWRSRKRSGRDSRPWASGDGTAGSADWYRPWGLLRPVDQVAVLARRYMHDHGVTREHLANVALACRAHAQRNPSAVMHGRPLTREDYFAARWVSEPLCLYDNCLETDGALAVVVVGADRARDCAQRPALIHAASQGFGAEQEAMTNYQGVDPVHLASTVCAASLWRQADIGPADVDVAQLYDAFTPMVLWSLEAYGLCGPGEAGEFTEEAGIQWPEARLPVNTAGGGLSEAYVHGYNLVVEGVRQIRGTSSCQAVDVESCLVTSGDIVPTSAVLLRR